MVFHDFGADLGPGPLPRLVRTVELTHQPDPAGTMLTSIRQVGIVFPRSRIGGRVLLATIGAFSANAPLLVTQGTAQPPDFVYRR